ncbi:MULTISPECIES: 50S ribosomal protein L25/general stress protein Ctc [Streptomyces]|jgi:large subunit ribosomal protein L25|uniref:50S ribosomal protein L25/general stress protein Ctc n=1 Tax=unclassified Streptomyces TaxID=2593676 RepID=UPI0004C7C309|nr:MULTISPECIES: 50S ribosomal protein L25/general stress protein Ctc [unclassified Streptomyces]MDX2728655.1 50S ribosomal protein L25/general stress protein Ctc [Streptomyces sp. PA03-2a]MDX3766251.1 50S ribosomal protein L25/general stress protein Ctc [Streptomyces sp. AK08-01B]MDX3816493.1 50S ribosomal protein L25/general stress protein Ctc [Streptomyces sp. AK08-01A]WSQ29134.1 50S ribosomal protein L25/general stress protein Ctc [Streptomyces sp. NBC_01230]SCZ04410.1 large subunit riboso
MAEIKLATQPRSEFGKGAARRARRDNQVPAVVYGHGAEPVHITLPAHELLLALRTPNVLIGLEIDGKNALVIPKAVQRNPLKGDIEHVDLLTVKRGEKVNVEIAVHVEGELAPGGNLLEYVQNTLLVEAEATHIPESVTVSVAGLDAGDSILAKDIPLPSGSVLAGEEDAVVLQVVSAQAEEPAAEAAEAEGTEA